MTSYSFPFVIVTRKFTITCFFPPNYNSMNVFVKSSRRRLLVRRIRLAYVASYNENCRYVCFQSDFPDIEHVIFGRQITLIESRVCQCVLWRSHFYISFRPSYAPAVLQRRCRLGYGMMVWGTVIFSTMLLRGSYWGLKWGLRREYPSRCAKLCMAVTLN